MTLDALREADTIPALEGIVLDFDYDGRVVGLRVSAAADSVLAPSLLDVAEPDDPPSAEVSRRRRRGMRYPMSADDQAAAAPSLVDSLKTYIDDVPEDERADALHGVFYGFYTRVAIIDRSTHELAAWAKDEAAALRNVPEPLVEALRDNALFVGQELFASRVRTMRAMGYVSSRLAELLDGAAPARPFTLTRAVAFDPLQERVRSYELSNPGEHPDLPYDALAYDPPAG